MGGGKEGRDGHRKSGGRRASHRREEEDGGGGGRRSGGDRASGSGGHSRERSLTGREKGLRESTSWRSESSALEADLGTPELDDSLEGARSHEGGPKSHAAVVDTAELERELGALFDGARRWLGDAQPCSPAAGRGQHRSSGRMLLPPPTAPERFAAGRQWPAPGQHTPPEGSELSCPAALFDQIYSAWLWGPGEAKPELQRTLDYREKWVERKARSSGIVESVTNFTNKKRWQRDKCLQEVGTLLGKVEAGERCYCSTRSLVAANSDWIGREFQLSLVALSCWHEAHADGSTLRCFLDAYSWAHDKTDKRHDRTQVWEGPPDQPHDQRRGLKRTISSVIAYARRRLLYDELEPDADPSTVWAPGAGCSQSVLSRMISKGLPMLIVHELVKTLLALVVGARVTTAAEARAILPVSREVLDLALSQRSLRTGGEADADALVSSDEQFRKDTIRCFVRCFELLSLSGLLRRREVATGAGAERQEKTRPVESYRLVGRSKDLAEFQEWSIRTADAISEYLLRPILELV